MLERVEKILKAEGSLERERVGEALTMLTSARGWILKEDEVFRSEDEVVTNVFVVKERNNG